MDKKKKYFIGIILLCLVIGNTVYAGELNETFTSSVSDEFTDTESLEEQKNESEVLSDSLEEKTVFESENDIESQEFDLLLNDGITIEEFESAVNNIYEDISLSAISEIGLVNIKLPPSISKEEFLSNEIVKSFIYLHGEMPDMQIPQNPINEVDINSVISDYTERSLFTEITNEELFDLMAWHVDEVTNERASLDISKGTGSKIALIDSGVDIEHPFLKGKINLSQSLSYVEGDSSIRDSNGHGTSVAGIIAQIAPEAIITSYRVIGDTAGNSEWTIDALLQAVEDGNDIVNMSLGTYKCRDIDSEMMTIASFDRAVQYAHFKDVIVVGSAGNKALDLDQYFETEHIRHLPGGLNGTVTISASNKDNLASYSNYGSNINYCAPGGDLVYIEGALDISQWIYCLYPTDKDNGLTSIGIPQGYSLSYGTSLAAPQATAALADILAVVPEASQNSIIQCLSNGTKDLGDVGYDVEFGDGKIDIEASLHLAQDIAQ